MSINELKTDADYARWRAAMIEVLVTQNSHILESNLRLIEAFTAYLQLIQMKDKQSDEGQAIV